MTQHWAGSPVSQAQDPEWLENNLLEEDCKPKVFTAQDHGKILGVFSGHLPYAGS